MYMILWLFRPTKTSVQLVHCFLIMLINANLCIQLSQPALIKLRQVTPKCRRRMASSSSLPDVQCVPCDLHVRARDCCFDRSDHRIICRRHHSNVTSSPSVSITHFPSSYFRSYVVHHSYCYFSIWIIICQSLLVYEKQCIMTLSRSFRFMKDCTVCALELRKKPDSLVADLEGAEPAPPLFWATDWRRHSWSCELMLNFDRSTVKHGTQNIQTECHQWLSDSFKRFQIRFRPGRSPGPTGELTVFLRPSSWFKGPYL